jgi:hypothetical protein
MHEWVKINLKDFEPCCARSDRALREVSGSGKWLFLKAVR